MFLKVFNGSTTCLFVLMVGITWYCAICYCFKFCIDFNSITLRPIPFQFSFSMLSKTCLQTSAGNLIHQLCYVLKPQLLFKRRHWCPLFIVNMLSFPLSSAAQNHVQKAFFQCMWAGPPNEALSSIYRYINYGAWLPWTNKSAQLNIWKYVCIISN